MNLPTGTVTLLFTDIEGSTRLVQQFGEDYAAIQTRHDAIMRQAWATHQGAVANTEGDAFFVAFANPLDAVRAAIAAQQALAAEPWPDGASVRVRMGLHTGQPQLGGDNYVGIDVHRAARIAAAGHGGQVLLSESTYALVKEQLPPGVTVIDLGQHRLRDLRTPKHLYQLAIPGLAVEFPPLRSLDGAPNNLPVQVTSFVGRESELAEIKELLNLSGLQDQTGLRVLTLIGPGGTGKTRLSLQVALEALKHFPDGVWLVELAPLSDPQLVVPAVASTLKLQATTDRPLESILIDYVRRRSLLLILDNCEHLIEECARLADSLQHACPQLRILASSREALGIAGERVYRVRSLPLPPEQQRDLASDVCDYAAVQLFRDRALAVKPDFAITADNCAAIGQICRRLDGIPLAIELAAARIRVLSPRQIAERLDDRFRLLTGGSRTALPRQRTLHALIDWSYDLLSQPECILLRRLSVFSGGFSLEAAEAVCSDQLSVSSDQYSVISDQYSLISGQPDNRSQMTDYWILNTDILDLLDQLVNKSLVVADEHEPGMRYRLLETIRQYAQEKLLESGEATVQRERHLDFFVNLNLQARDASFALKKVQAWAEKLRPEVDNLRAAQAWALEHDLHAVMQLASAVTSRWNVGAQILETHRFLQMVLARAEADPAYGAEGSAENRSLLAATYFSACTTAFGLGQSHETLRLALRSAAIAREADDMAAVAAALGMVATAAAFMGDLEMAGQYAAETIQLAEKEGNRLALAMVLVSSLFLTAMSQREDHDRIWADWSRGIAMLREGEDYWALGIGYQLAAMVVRVHGDIEKAQFYAEASLASYEMLSAAEAHFATSPRTILAELALDRGELDRAEQEFKNLLPSWLDSGNRGAVARVLEMLAFTSRARTERVNGGPAPAHLTLAATLLGAADAIRSTYQAEMTPHERVQYEAEVATLRQEMDAQAFATAWASGGSMDLDAAVDWALADGEH